MLRTHHLRLATRFVAHRFRALHPFEVQAALLNACNLRCAYCSCPDLETALLSTQQWEDAIAGLGALGTMRIKFQGGEPTLRHDFRRLCAAAQGAGILTAVVTNGLQFAGDPSLFDHLDEIVFSLDSVDPVHNDHLRGEGVHARVLDAIDRALARRLRLFINMVVTRDNFDGIDAMLAFCEARGIGLHAQPVVFGRRFYRDAARPLALGNEQVRAMHHKLAAWKRAGRPLMFAAATYDKVTRWADYGELTRHDSPSSCMAGRFYVHIEPNGDVHPCVQHGADFTPKNLVRDGLEAALANAQHHNCGDCFSAYLNERKAVFGLRPAALLEIARRG